MRPYQTAAVDAAYDYLRTHEDDPVVVAPTGAGKSWIIARIVGDVVNLWSGRAIVLAHVRELLEQNADKIRRLCPDIPVGLYSAGLKRRNTDEPVIVAGIQSVHERACELGPFDLAIVDEAHLVPAEGDGMFRKFLADARIVNPSLRVVGLTASPYRLDSGPICGPDRIFGGTCHDIGVRELIRDGFLCGLKTRGGAAKIDTSKLHVRAGEFVASEVESLADEEGLVERACAEIVELTRDRNSVLIFAAGVGHGRRVQRVLQEQHGVECGFVHGETPTTERDDLLGRFRGEPDGLFERSPLKYLVNIGICTTGFDSPVIDCVVLLRPTASVALYLQMVGRGLRVHPSKQDTLVLDFGGNIERHGPIDLIRRPEERAKGTGEAPGKECPACHAVIAAGYAACPDCGHKFPPPERTEHEAKAAEVGILSGETIDTSYQIRDVFYHEHAKKGASDDAPKTLRVDYQLGLDHFVSEWVCFEHKGWARRKAEQWWRKRSPDPPPDTAREAVDLCEAGAVAIPERITVRTVVGEPFDRIIACELGELPEPSPAWGEIDLTDVPF